MTGQATEHSDNNRSQSLHIPFFLTKGWTSPECFTPPSPCKEKFTTKESEKAIVFLEFNYKFCILEASLVFT